MASETKDLRRIRRGCTNREMRALLLGVISGGTRYRMTKSGIMFFGSAGSTSAHFTASDHRAVSNLRAVLRNIGIDVPEGK